MYNISRKTGGELMEKYFLYDEHLGIEIPHLQEDWEEIPEKNATCYFTKMGTSSRENS